MSNYIDGFWCVNNNRGMSRYVKMFSETQGKKLHFIRVSKHIPKSLLYLIYILWEQFFLQVTLKIRGATEITYAYNSPPIFKIFNITSNLIVHDLIFFDRLRGSGGLTKAINSYRKLTLRYGIKNINCVYCVSETSAKEFKDWINFPVEIKVIPNKIKLRSYKNSSNEEITGMKKSYLNLCVITGLAPSKNSNFLRDLVSHSEKLETGIIFHIIGISEKAWSEKFANVFLYENVNEGVKNTLINKSDFLFFPSLTEGFGIPLIEAGILRTGIICSNIDVFNEICGENAIYFDPKDMQKCHEILEELQKSKRNNTLHSAYPSIKVEDFYKICLKKYVY